MIIIMLIELLTLKTRDKNIYCYYICKHDLCYLEHQVLLINEAITYIRSTSYLIQIPN